MVSWLPFHSRRMTEMTTAPGDGLFYVTRHLPWSPATPDLHGDVGLLLVALLWALTSNQWVTRATGKDSNALTMMVTRSSCPVLGTRPHLCLRWRPRAPACAFISGKARQVQLVHPEAPAVRQLRCDRPPQTWPGKSHAALEDGYQYSRWWTSHYPYHLGVFRRLAPGKKETIFSWPEMYAIMQETYGNGIVIGCILSLTACISSKLVMHK